LTLGEKDEVPTIPFCADHSRRPVLAGYEHIPCERPDGRTKEVGPSEKGDGSSICMPHAYGRKGEIAWQVS
ncbi:MAG: hypothetical protein ACREBC_09505, partial [Pyrinomonadaceae bacterium]